MYLFLCNVKYQQFCKSKNSLITERLYQQRWTYVIDIIFVLFPLDKGHVPEYLWSGCTDRFHAIFHMPRSLKKVDVIYICFLLFYNIELYINKILR